MNSYIFVSLKVAYNWTRDNLPMFNWPTAQWLLIWDLEKSGQSHVSNMQQYMLGIALMTEWEHKNKESSTLTGLIT